MPKEVVMPALGMAQETGVLVAWLKAEGDEVSKGEMLMEVETDKAVVEVEAAASGTLVNITAQPGDVIPVGQVIALILAPGETAPEPKAKPALAEAPQTAAPSAAGSPVEDQAKRSISPVAARIAADHHVDLAQVKPAGIRIRKDDVLAHLAAQQTATAGKRILASPKARRLAREQGLDLAQINGRGPEGAVLAADVLEAASRAQIPATETRPAPVSETVPISRMWQVMAQRLTESWQTTPHFYLEAEANAARLQLWREKAQQRLSEKLTFTDLLVKLVASALRQHPRLNAKWVNGTIVLNPDINIGLAVAVEEGLLVPVIHHADSMRLKDIAARRKDIITHAQTNKLSLTDMSDGTFTISNLGMYGVDGFKAIVNPPEAAILALGRIADKVVPLDGQPTIQPMLKLTLSCDHRVVDGVRGAQFLQTLVSFIEDPLAILD